MKLYVPAAYWNIDWALSHFGEDYEMHFYEVEHVKSNKYKILRCVTKEDEKVECTHYTFKKKSIEILQKNQSNFIEKIQTLSVKITNPEQKNKLDHVPLPIPVKVHVPVPVQVQPVTPLQKKRKINDNNIYKKNSCGKAICCNPKEECISRSNGREGVGAKLPWIVMSDTMSSDDLNTWDEYNRAVVKTNLVCNKCASLNPGSYMDWSRRHTLCILCKENHVTSEKPSVLRMNKTEIERTLSICNKCSTDNAIRASIARHEVLVSKSMIPVKKIFCSMNLDVIMQFKGFSMPMEVSTFPDIGITGNYTDLYSTEKHSLTIIIEVDPNQHRMYNRKEEVTRNMRILKNIDSRRVLLIRFSSIGRFQDSSGMSHDPSPNMRIMILRTWVMWYLESLNNLSGDFPDQLVLYLFYNYDNDNMSFVRQREIYSPDFRKNVGQTYSSPSKGEMDNAVWRYHADPSDEEAVVKLHRNDLQVSVSGCMSNLKRVPPSRVWPELTSVT